MMQDQKFYLDAQGIPCAFAADGSQDHLIKPEMAGPLSDVQVQGILNPSAKITVAALKEIVTECRWEVETGGITLPSGVRVTTGIDDQNRITSVITNARLATLDTVSFKAASGWVTLTIAELEGIAAAIAQHVQECFNAERTHHEAIDALAQLHADDAHALQQALEAYDLELGWPVAG